MNAQLQQNLYLPILRLLCLYGAVVSLSAPSVGNKSITTKFKSNNSVFYCQSHHFHGYNPHRQNVYVCINRYFKTNKCVYNSNCALLLYEEYLYAHPFKKCFYPNVTWYMLLTCYIGLYK